MWGTIIRAPFLFLAALHYFPMKMTRRISAFALLIGLFSLSIASRTTEKKVKSGKYLVFVGTYTSKTESKGIYAFEFDADTGKLAPKGVAAETQDPSWVVVHPKGKYLYAANERGKSSTISAFAIEPKTGKLTLLNQLPAVGEDPCYLSFDNTGQFLLSANYTSGTSVAFEILPNGTPGTHLESPNYGMSPNVGKRGPNKERQEAPHAHWIQTSLDNHYVYVADLGLDSILIFRFNPGAWKIGKPILSSTPNGDFFDVAAVLAPGTGPRHAVFSSGERFLYVLGELKSTVTVFAHDGEKFRSIQVIPTLPAGFSGRNDAAEIAVRPDGKFLYTSNRGHDSIAVFAIDPAKGTLTFVAHVPTGGKEPRHFAIDPTGKYLLAENQLSNNIVVFKIDPATGGLTPTGQVAEVPSPVDITFVAAE
jgi:6-phosphogluconolactonase